MALIPKVGRKTWSTRLLIAGLYFVLTLGAITMVYPFLLMLSSSITSRVDVNSYSIVPKYLWDNGILFAKYADDKYQGDIENINSRYGTEFATIEKIAKPNLNPKNKRLLSQVRDWQTFAITVPSIWKEPCFQGNGKDYSKLRWMYQAWLEKKFNGDIKALNKSYIEENESFADVYLPFENRLKRDWQPDNSPKMNDWIGFKAGLPTEFTQVPEIEKLYAQYLQEDKYEGSIDKLNKAWGTSYKSFSSIRLSYRMPKGPRSADWQEYVRTKLPYQYMDLDDSAIPVFQAFLKSRYGTIDALNKKYGSIYASFSDLGLPGAMLQGSPQLVDWNDFVDKALPISAVKARTVENRYRTFLAAKFKNIGAVNKAYGTKYRSFLSITPPIYAADWVYVNQHTSALRSDFVTRNYKLVLSYIALHGRALLNTLIFVLIVIVTHLIVNPLCAYSLSRYRLKYGSKVLLYLLATMAFPAEVAMIPNFLLLKQFHMLNTYWALVLPGMANGFSIFLLKGFFDSLPRELYEAATIDGASETRMFFNITVPMSKPIFAVIALQAFTYAYGAFMFAMLVCQDPKMWTLMVWLYELQIGSPQFITMAALTVAAIPTLLVFIFMQNIIMKGIILPSFK